jgi:hypothetical protein
MFAVRGLRRWVETTGTADDGPIYMIGRDVTARR